MTTAILGSILTVLALILGIVRYFVVKSPEQIEQEHLNKIKENEDNLAKAITKTTAGDPADLSKLLNRK